MKRQSKIIDLVKNRDIGTQEELADLLCEAGFSVTQATISRDIRELKLSKTTAANGGLKYTVSPWIDNQLNCRYIRVFCDGVISLDYANHIIVIKTLDGMAMAVAAALDAMGFADILGTIAGDDTIFCVVKSEDVALSLLQKLNNVRKTEAED